jgi:hypothetical protein
LPSGSSAAGASAAASCSVAPDVVELQPAYVSVIVGKAGPRLQVLVLVL